MNIWLINPNGPIPGEEWRDYRFTLLGEALAERGHRVTWWTANFSHHFKRFRSRSWQSISVRPNFMISLVPTTGYARNISLGRLKYEAMYAKRLYSRAIESMPPHCIVGVDPPQVIGFTAARIAKRFGIPLILDVFDLWPELFDLAFPRLLRPLAPRMLFPLYVLRRRNLRQADGVVALCDTYLDVARRQIVGHRSIPFLTIFNGIDVSAFRFMLNANPNADEQERHVAKQPSDIWAIYAGSLGNNYDIHTLLHAAVLLKSQGSRVRILIAGDGPFRMKVMHFIESHQMSNCIYLGRLETRQLIGIYTFCDIGICAYSRDSNVSMPDKAYDYMAAGLPIVNSLRGEFEMFMRNAQIGLQYEAGDARSLAAALELLAREEAKRKVMAGNSYEAGTGFDCHVQYSKYADFIETVVLDRSNVAQCVGGVRE